MEGLSREEEKKYDELRRRAGELGDELQKLRTQLKSVEKEFEKIVKKKWALEEKMVPVQVCSPGASGRRPQALKRVPKQRESLRELLAKAAKGEISEAEFQKRARRL